MNSALSILRKEEHVSVSSLGTYVRCPKQYEHRYILKTQASHRSSALAFGSAVHEALAAYYETLREGISELTYNSLCSVFRDSWTEQLEGNLPVLFTDKESADSLTDTGVKMMRVFLEEAPRYAKVVDVEAPWSVELWDENKNPLTKLVGVFDAVVQNQDGSFRILEHKTGARKWSQDKLDYDSQVSAYSLVAPLVGLGDASVTIQLLTKTKTPGFEVYQPHRSEADRNDFGSMAISVSKAINAGAFYPVRDWHCRGCEYASHCVAG